MEAKHPVPAVPSVRHQDGWCATKSGHVARESTTSVRTLCDKYVVLPLGGEVRSPTCSECRQVLERKAKRATRARKAMRAKKAKKAKRAT